jgi:hypothetical protein
LSRLQREEEGMYKQVVRMVLLVGVLLSAAAIANGGSLNGILNGVTTDGLYSSGLDRGLEVVSVGP